MVAQLVGARRRRRCCGRSSRVVGVKLDYFELDAADAGLPTGRLVFTDLADGVRLLQAEARARIRRADGLGLREDGLLLVAAVDVVLVEKVGDRAGTRWSSSLLSATGSRGARLDWPDEEPSPALPYLASFPRGVSPQFVHRRALRLRAPSDFFHSRRSGAKDGRTRRRVTWFLQSPSEY